MKLKLVILSLVIGLVVLPLTACAEPAPAPARGVGGKANQQIADGL